MMGAAAIAVLISCSALTQRRYRAQGEIPIRFAHSRLFAALGLNKPEGWAAIESALR